MNGFLAVCQGENPAETLFDALAGPLIHPDIDRPAGPSAFPDHVFA
jgi:hypothetical protein